MDGVVVARPNGGSLLPAGVYASLGQANWGNHWFGVQADGRVRHSYQTLDTQATEVRVTHVAELQHGLACGIRLDGTLTCWGAQASSMVPPSGRYVEIGGSNVTAVATRNDGIPVSWAIYGSQPDIQLPVDGGYGPLAVINSSACFAKRSGGAVTCPGMSAAHLPNPNTGFVQLAVGRNTTFCGVRADGTVACWGANASNTLGTVPTGDDFVFVSVARSASAAYAVRRSGEVVGFGSGAVRLLP